MTRFEAWILGVESDRSTNCATTYAYVSKAIYVKATPVRIPVMEKFFWLKLKEIRATEQTIEVRKSFFGSMKI